MVRKKEARKRLSEVLREQSRRYDEQNPIVETRYVVTEVTPPQFIHSEYDEGDWMPKRVTVVPLIFETREDAEQWLGQYVPDDGKTLEVRKYIKRKHVYYDWELA